MSTAENKNEVFKQNLDTKGEFQHIFQIHLLFKERENRPQGKVIQMPASGKQTSWQT